MTIKESRGIYASCISAYNQKKYDLAKEKELLDEKIKKTENGNVIFAEDAARLELSYNAVNAKQEEYRKYMENLNQQWNGLFMAEAAKQEAESAEEYFGELSKIMLVARRMMHGDIVPPKDEKKLAEYDDKLYQLAKNAQMMAQLKEKKVYDSLWDDEKKEEKTDPMEKADNSEAFSSGPQIKSVDDTIEAAISDNGE